MVLFFPSLFTIEESLAKILIINGISYTSFYREKVF